MNSKWQLEIEQIQKLVCKENLSYEERCICPNCDSQLDTYKSKNKNSARIYHRQNHR